MRSISSYIALGSLTLIGLIENYGRILYSVSIIPFIDTTSYEYSLLNGVIFSFFYGLGGLILILICEVYFKYSKNYFKIETYLLSIASFLFSICLGLTATVNTFIQLALLRVLIGITQSALIPLATSIISYYFDPNSRGFAMAVFQLGTYIAYSSSLSLGTFIYDVYGWKMGYIAVGLLGVFFACVLFIVLSFCPPSLSSDSFISNTSNLNTGDQSSTIFHSENSDTSRISGSRRTKGPSIKYRQLDSQPSLSEKNPLVSMNGEFKSIARGDEDEDEDDLEEVQLNSPPSFNGDDDSINNKIGIDNVSESRLLCQHTNDTSFLQRIYDTLRELIQVWNSNPVVYLIAIATGIRLAAGYVWSSYTTIFFSELWIRQSLGGNQFQTCSYSFNSTLSTYDIPSSIADDVCGSDYPYCAYYSNYNTGIGSSDTQSSYFCSILNPTPWHNVGLTHQDIEKYLSWMPLVGSGLGSVCGAILSDKLAEHTGFISVRPLLIALGNLAAVPIVAYAFISSYPTCFLIQIASGFVGELYFSQSSVLVILLTPVHLVACSIALFSLIINTIAGASLLLVPYIFRIYRSQFTAYEADFTIASYYTLNVINGNYSSTDISTIEVPLSLSGGGGDSLQAALIAIQVSMYLCAGILYLICFCYYYIKYDRI